MASLRIAAHTHKTPKRKKVSPTAYSARRVREMLREIALVFRATRVVRQIDEGVVAVEAP